MHENHELLKGTILFDGCGRCEEIGHEKRLWELDDDNLFRLGVMASRRNEPAMREIMSNVEHYAVDHLRLMARIVFKSGITQDVAK